jgi:hypothetical protein
VVEVVVLVTVVFVAVVTVIVVTVVSTRHVSHNTGQSVKRKPPTARSLHLSESVGHCSGSCAPLQFAASGAAVVVAAAAGAPVVATHESQRIGHVNFSGGPKLSLKQMEGNSA